MVVLSVCVCMYVHIEYIYIFKAFQLEMHALFLGVKWYNALNLLKTL